jgi:ribosome-associated protein
MTTRKTTTKAKATKSAAAKPAKGKSKSSLASGSSDDDGGLAIALEALQYALDKKAVEPVLLDVRELCGYCNFQLVVSGRSERQVDAITDGVVAGLRDRGMRALGTEGKRSGQWSLLDFGDVVVHVFNHSVREHYDLEGLWNDAPRVEIEVPDDARLPADTY